MLRDLEHIQVDGLETAYLFFFNKQGRHRLTHEAAQGMQAHIEEAFLEWISDSAHFAVNPLPLTEGCQGLAILALASSESDSIPQLIGSAPPSAVRLAPWRTMEATNQARLLLLGHGEDRLRFNPWWEVGETHLHPLPSGEELTLMCTLNN